MRVLVTGGAGYLGSVVTEELLNDGPEVVVFDSLTKGHRAASAGAQPERITINDTATGDAYDLDPATRTATRNRVLRLAMALEQASAGSGTTGEVALSRDTVPAPFQNFFFRVGAGEAKLTPDSSPIFPRSESLGTQTIEGVEAQGSRSTITIPAGKIGNERAIEIVHETWYSPQLQTVVMSRVFDPRSGEVVYRLTNINRAEPDSSLFEVPSDYKIQQDSGDTFRFGPPDKPGAVRRTRTMKPPEP